MVATTVYGAKSRKELRLSYGIGKDTFRKWCQLASITHSNRILTPLEVRQFIDHHGEPEPVKAD
jgi:hypothetical protein